MTLPDKEKEKRKKETRRKIDGSHVYIYICTYDKQLRLKKATYLSRLYMCGLFGFVVISEKLHFCLLLVVLTKQCILNPRSQTMT